MPSGIRQNNILGQCSKRLSKSLHHLQRQVVRPTRLIHAIPSATDIVVELHPLILELSYWLDLDERGAYGRGSTLLEEGWMQEDIVTMFME